MFLQPATEPETEVPRALTEDCTNKTKRNVQTRISMITNWSVNTLRTGLLNCLNARSRGLTFRHRASCIYGLAFRYSPENAFYIFNQQIHFII